MQRIEIDLIGTVHVMLCYTCRWFEADGPQILVYARRGVQ